MPCEPDFAIRAATDDTKQLVIGDGRERDRCSVGNLLASLRADFHVSDSRMSGRARQWLGSNVAPIANRRYSATRRSGNRNGARTFLSASRDVERKADKNVRARALERERAQEGESPSVAELPATN